MTVVVLKLLLKLKASGVLLKGPVVRLVLKVVLVLKLFLLVGSAV